MERQRNLNPKDFMPRDTQPARDPFTAFINQQDKEREHRVTETDQLRTRASILARIADLKKQISGADKAIRAKNATPPTPTTPKSPEKNGKPQLFPQLSPRQDEIAALLLQGKTYSQIADTLDMSSGTVGVHVGHIRRKLNMEEGVRLAGVVENLKALLPNEETTQT